MAPAGPGPCRKAEEEKRIGRDWLHRRAPDPRPAGDDKRHQPAQAEWTDRQAGGRTRAPRAQGSTFGYHRLWSAGHERAPRIDADTTSRSSYGCTITTPKKYEPQQSHRHSGQKVQPIQVCVGREAGMRGRVSWIDQDWDMRRQVCGRCCPPSLASQPRKQYATLFCSADTYRLSRSHLVADQDSIRVLCLQKPGQLEKAFDARWGTPRWNVLRYEAGAEVGEGIWTWGFGQVRGFAMSTQPAMLKRILCSKYSACEAANIVTLRTNCFARSRVPGVDFLHPLSQHSPLRIGCFLTFGHL